MSQVPEPWATAMIAVGFTDPRYDDPRPSMSRLAEEAGVHTTTVSRMVHGRKRPDPGNVARVAAALRVDVRKVSEWVDQARTVPTEFVVPPEVNLLTRREQDALTELIRAIAATREGVVEHEQSGSSSMSQAPTTGESGWGHNEATGEVAPPPPGTSSLLAGPLGTKPTDFDLPSAPVRQRSSRRKGTHTPRGKQDRMT